MSRDPRWRDIAATGLAARHLGRLEPAKGGRALVVEDGRSELVDALVGRGWSVTRWNRIATPDLPGEATPPAGPFDLVAMRLHKSKELTEMSLHLLLARLADGGAVFLYGAKDEGIRSGARRLEPLTGAWATRATGGHARILEWRAPSTGVSDLPGLRGSVEEWSIPVDDREVWPGVFAHGAVDAGTELLLEHLPEPRGPALDFGAGTGVLGRALVRAGLPMNELTLVEPDALAIEGARQILPDAELLCRVGWPGPPDSHRGWQLIVSNPPYHEGKAESMAIIEELIAGAAQDLQPGGELWIVVQRRLPVEVLLASQIAAPTVVVDRGPFRVWAVSRP